MTLSNLFGSSEPAGGGAYQTGRNAGAIFMVVVAVAGAVGIYRWYSSRTA